MLATALDTHALTSLDAPISRATTGLDDADDGALTDDYGVDRIDYGVTKCARAMRR